MGRTIPSFRIAAEMERVKWRPFRWLLIRKDRKMFACMMQASPVVFHSVIMSIMFHHYKQLMKLTDVKKNGELQIGGQPEAPRTTTLDVYCLSGND
jgi:hypothetical protein